MALHSGFAHTLEYHYVIVAAGAVERGPRSTRIQAGGSAAAQQDAMPTEPSRLNTMQATDTGTSALLSEFCAKKFASLNPFCDLIVVLT